MNKNFIITGSIPELDQLFDPVAKFLGQGQELPFAQGNKAAVGLAHLFQQGF